MPGFLDFLRTAIGGLTNAAQATPGFIQGGQQSQNPLVAGLSSLAGVPFQALQMPGSVLSNYLEKFRAPGVENRLRSIQADQAAANLATSPEGQAMQFNPTPGYTSAQGTPQKTKVPYAQLPPEHKARLRMLAQRVGIPDDEASLQAAWEGATNIPTNLPPPVLTKEGATIRNLEAETDSQTLANTMMRQATAGGIPKNFVPLTMKLGNMTLGISPPAVTVPAPGAGEAPAATPGAPRPEVKPPATIGKTRTGPNADAKGRANQPFTYTMDDGSKLKGTFSKDGMQATAEDGSKWVLDEKQGTMVRVPEQQLPAGEAGSAAAPSPAPGGGALPPPTPDEVYPDAPAVTGPRPGGPAAAAPAAPTPAAPVVPAPAPAPPAPVAPAAPVAPVIPTPPGLPSAAPAPAVPAAPAPGGMPPVAGGAPPAPAAPATPDPDANAAMELLEPGSSTRPPLEAQTGFPPPAPEEMATGAAAGALAGQQFAQAETRSDPMNLGDLGGVRQPDARTPRGETVTEIEKPATLAQQREYRYRVAMDKSAELYDYVTDRRYTKLEDALKDNHVNGLIEDWWTKRDLEVKTMQQEAATRGKANAAVQRQLGSLMAMENALDFISKDLRGPNTAGVDVPISLGNSNTSDFLDKAINPIPIIGPLVRETFSASGTGPPFIGAGQQNWYSIRQMAKDPTHPWQQQAARLGTMEGTSGLGVRSMGDVGTMTDKEKDIFAKNYIPLPNDTPELRKTKVNILRELLHGIRDGMLRGTLTTPDAVRDYMRSKGVPLGEGPGEVQQEEPERRRLEIGPQSRRLQRTPATAARQVRKVA